MEPIPDFSSASSRLLIKPSVLESLYLSLPYRDVFPYFSCAPSATAFWSRVDSLPPALSAPLHSLALELSAPPSRDIPSDCLRPALQSYWAAACAASGLRPQSSQPSAVPRAGDALIAAAAAAAGCAPDSGAWRVGDLRLSARDLRLMCEARARGGMPWLFLGADDARAGYCAAACAGGSAALERGLRALSFGSAAALRAECCGAVPEFSLSAGARSALTALLDSAADALSRAADAPYLGGVDSAAAARAQALTEQLSLPIHQRAAFCVTPQALQGRLGMPCARAFEPLSLAELLLADADGRPYPLPHAGCAGAGCAGLDAAFCRAALRRCAARELRACGYAKVTEQAADVLADVMVEEVRRIALTCAQMGGEAPDRERVEHALEVNGYDVDTLKCEQ